MQFLLNLTEIASFWLTATVTNQTCLDVILIKFFKTYNGSPLSLSLDIFLDPDPNLINFYIDLDLIRIRWSQIPRIHTASKTRCYLALVVSKLFVINIIVDF